MKIYVEIDEMLINIVELLVKKGLTFEVKPKHGIWEITLTGGY